MLMFPALYCSISALIYGVLIPLYCVSEDSRAEPPIYVKLIVAAKRIVVFSCYSFLYHLSVRVSSFLTKGQRL
jgi:hypothetical protein